MTQVKYLVSHHVSQVILVNGDGKKLFGNIYDPSHFNAGKFNLLGGNMSKQDRNPWELLQRELREEFRYSTEEVIEFNKKLIKWSADKGIQDPWQIKGLASPGDIEFVRESVLESLVPFGDYLCHIPGFAGEKGKADVVYSVWATRLSKPVWECVEDNQRVGRSLVVEGFTKIVTIDDLVMGEPICAAGTVPILTDFLNLRITPLANPCMITAYPIGMPRVNFADYAEFDYRCLREGREEG